MVLPISRIVVATTRWLYQASAVLSHIGYHCSLNTAQPICHLGSLLLVSSEFDNS